MRRRIDWRDDSGYAGGAESVPFGVLVFVVGALLIANLWAVIDTKMAANAAAREYVHAMAEATDEADARATGAQAAQSVIQVWGRDPAKLVPDDIAFYDANGNRTVWRRCARIVVTVRYNLALINIPLVGATWGPDPIAVRATRTELVDPFRSSADVEGQC